MKLAVAQIRPSIGPIQDNVARHGALVDLAVQHGANLIVFPELSLTGYEPARAAEWSRSPDDSCLASFQQQSDQNNIIIGVGLPLRTKGLPRISTLIFKPNSPPWSYSKRYLHADELPYFGRGSDPDAMIHSSPLHHYPKVALAICYELSVPEHAQMAFEAGATAYVASVAKTDSGIENASQRLSDIAKQNSALVMLSNCLGIQDGAECVGHSSVWGRNGQLLARLDSEKEGVIVLDHNTEYVVTDTFDGQVDRISVS